MDPTIRTIVLAGCSVFVIAFAGMTLSVMMEHGVNIFTLAALAVIGLLGAGLVGALLGPHDQ